MATGKLRRISFKQYFLLVSYCFVVYLTELFKLSRICSGYWIY